MVTAAELLLLPRAQRLEAVRRRDVRDAVAELRQVPGEIRVPRVRVDELCAVHARGHREIDGHRLEGRVAAHRVPRPVRLRFGAVRAEAVNRQVDEIAQLAREVLDVNAGAAVDLRREFAGEQ